MPSPNGHGPKRAILYARVSTDEQARSGYSLAQQLEALREYAAREGLQILEEVSDPGQSGASLERPGMDRVRDLVAAGGISVVLAQDRDRFAREPAYHYLLRREFEEYGTKIRALNDRGDDSPEGELTDGILDQLAKFERAKTAERTRRGRLRKAREGKVVAGRSPRYGFKLNASRDGYEVDEEKMRVVRRIFREVAEGTTFLAIAHVLEREGVPTPRGARFWDRGFFRKVVLDDVYRPHTFEEVAAVVSPEVAARLNPEKLYGLWWFNRRRMTSRPVSEVSQNGRRYGRKYTSYTKPKEEWIAVPVPESSISREMVEVARERGGKGADKGQPPTLLGRPPPMGALGRGWPLRELRVRLEEPEACEDEGRAALQLLLLSLLALRQARLQGLCQLAVCQRDEAGGSGMGFREGHHAEPRRAPLRPEPRYRFGAQRLARRPQGRGETLAGEALAGG
jgi:site-specific DNA recombinase